MSKVKMLRINQVKERTGMSRSAIYGQMDEGVFPASVSMGRRMAAWPEGDIDALIAARIAGWSTEQIRALVVKLHKARKVVDL